VEEDSRHVILPEVSNRPFKVPGANPFEDGPRVEVHHEWDETGLWDHLVHGGALNGFDCFHCEGGFGGGQGVDVVEDVDGFGDAEGRTHLCEHPGLGLARCWELAICLSRPAPAPPPPPPLSLSLPLASGIIVFDMSLCPFSGGGIKVDSRGGLDTIMSHQHQTPPPSTSGHQYGSVHPDSTVQNAFSS